MFPSEKLTKEQLFPLINAAAERNKHPILATLKTLLLPTTEPLEIVEISSGFGQHAALFASELSHINWQPTDVDPDYIPHIITNTAALSNVKHPILGADVTVAVPDWPTPLPRAQFDVVYNSNLMHVSPWKCTLGLFSTAGYLVKPGGRLITYGPYAENGVLSPESNVEFDKFLKIQNKEFGVRDLNKLVTVAQQHGFELMEKIDMPANNKTLVFQKLEKKA